VTTVRNDPTNRPIQAAITINATVIRPSETPALVRAGTQQLAERATRKG
jgi:hypothetical protein